MVERRLATTVSEAGVDRDRLEYFIDKRSAERLGRNDLADFAADRIDLTRLPNANLPITIGDAARLLVLEGCVINIVFIHAKTPAGTRQVRLVGGRERKVSRAVGVALRKN